MQCPGEGTAGTLRTPALGASTPRVLPGGGPGGKADFINL